MFQPLKNSNEPLVTVLSLMRDLLKNDFENYFIKSVYQLRLNDSILRREHLCKVEANMRWFKEFNLRFDEICAVKKQAIDERSEFECLARTLTLIQIDTFRGYKGLETRPSEVNIVSVLPERTNLEKLMCSAERIENFGLRNQNGPVYTFQKPEIVENIVQTTAPYFDHLPLILKDTVWSTLLGFRNKVDEIKLREIATIENVSVDICDYINSENKEHRIIPINSGFFERYVAAQVYVKPEEKVDDLGQPYVKYRYINNCKPANACYEPPGELKYDFPDGVFLIDQFYDELCESNFITLSDRSDYYRSLLSSPISWEVCLIKPICTCGKTSCNARQKWWLDVCERQGTTWSPFNAQRTSVLMDYDFNNQFRMEEKPPVQISIQDDSIILRSQKSTPQLVRDHNEKWGMINNLKKSYSNVTAGKWHGYWWDVDNQALSLPEKRLEKIKNSIEKILKDKKSTLRTYCSVLGKLWSGRLVIMSQGVSLSCILFRTRKWARVDSRWFWTKNELQNEDYDRLVDQNPDLASELWLAYDIISRVVPFEDVKNRIDWIKSPYPQYPQARVNLRGPFITQDAATGVLGKGLAKQACWIVLDNKYKMLFSGAIPTRFQGQSINFLELFSLVQSVIFLIHFIRFTGLPIKKISVFCDNTTAQTVAATQRCNLQSAALYRLGLLLSFLELSTGLEIKFERIPTEENMISDFGTRDGRFDHGRASSGLIEKFYELFC